VSLDPHQAQLLAQAQRLERFENRICTVEQAVQTLVVRPPGEESWIERHCWAIVACVICSVIAFLAGMAVQ
jgi:hypothetical protein